MMPLHIYSIFFPKRYTEISLSLTLDPSENKFDEAAKTTLDSSL